MSLQVDHLTKSFGGDQVLADISFHVSPGEVLAILGESGSGKSTLLALVAGLLEPDTGQIAWKGASLINTPPHERHFGLMFQDFALFPHLNVFENVAFGLRMRGLAGDELQNKVEQALALVHLSEFRARNVDTLSGGEQQRVALARSMAPNPRLLMLDEPLGSLDRGLRDELLLEIRHILSDLGQTAIYVTHDQEEAFRIADRALILTRDGRVAREGTPQEIYRSPTSRYVAKFLGLDNFMRATARSIAGRKSLETSLGIFPLEVEEEGDVTVLFRPDAVSLNGSGSCQLRGILKERVFSGNFTQVVVEFDQLHFKLEFPTRVSLPPVGEELLIDFEPEEALQLLT